MAARTAVFLLPQIQLEGGEFLFTDQASEIRDWGIKSDATNASYRSPIDARRWQREPPYFSSPKFSLLEFGGGWEGVETAINTECG
jgi:hypothetical protein